MRPARPKPHQLAAMTTTSSAFPVVDRSDCNQCQSAHRYSMTLCDIRGRSSCCKPLPRNLGPWSFGIYICCYLVRYNHHSQKRIDDERSPTYEHVRINLSDNASSTACAMVGLALVALQLTPQCAFSRQARQVIWRQSGF